MFPLFLAGSLVAGCCSRESRSVWPNFRQKQPKKKKESFLCVWVFFKRQKWVRKAQLRIPRNFHFFCRGKTNFLGITSELAIATDQHPGGYIQACPTLFLAQKACVYWEKDGHKNAFLGRPACRFFVMYYVVQNFYKLAAPRKAFYLATFFSMCITKTSFAPKDGWDMLVYAPQDGHWLASFEVRPPPNS